MVELFAKRDFVCDCGTKRFPDSAPCTLRSNPTTGLKGQVTGEAPREGNAYNHNFAGKFCACGETYDPATEKGTMYQCIGLGTVDQGGCGEDWYHPECLLGRPRATDTKVKTELLSNGESEPDPEMPRDGGEAEQIQPKVEECEPPIGFPGEDDFDALICYKCVEANPWVKKYAGSPGFIPLARGQVSPDAGVKRKAIETDDQTAIKRTKTEEVAETPTTAVKVPEAASTADINASELLARPIHETLPTPPAGALSLCLPENYRDSLCKCPNCFPDLSAHPYLLEDEETHEPPVSEPDGSVSGNSLLERGEAALSTMDRMRAIEGVMAYNHLKDKVKAFLQPFADSGRAVGAEDVKAYFAELRGDEEGKVARAGDGDGSGDAGDNRRE